MVYSLLTIIACLGAADAPTANEPVAASDWTLSFVDNPKLPPVFRQFTVARPDGSRQRAYLAWFDDEPAQRKPVLLYLDGSGAGSLFIEHDGRVAGTLFGILAKFASDEYHVAAGDKRGVAFLDSARGAADHASAEYAEHATYDGRVAEAKLLLDALLAQPTVDPTRVLVVGHSEGADVAAGLAAVDPRVTHVAFLAGGGPTQLFDLLVLQRKRMRADGASPAEIEQAMGKLEDDFRRIFADPDSTTRMFQGHAYRRWSTFCQHPPADNLLRTKAKLYVAHGSEDTSGPIEAFDYLVAELIRHGRRDVTIRRFANRDHGLRDVSKPATGPPMQDVFGEIIEWAKSAD